MKPGTSFLVALGSLIVLSALFFLLERIAGCSRPSPLFRRGWGTDVVYWFATLLFTKPLIRLLLLVPLSVLMLTNVTSLSLLKPGLYQGFGPLSRQPNWLQAVEIFLLVDFLAYWTHRLFHRAGWWHFHAVHHSSEELDWLGSLRIHPVNELINKLAQVTPVLLLGFNPAVTLGSAPLITLYAIFLHAQLNWDFGPLRHILASPVFHRWHHSRQREAWDKNFAGLLPIWDILFGTYYMPKNRFPENFGICQPMPDGYLRQFWSPFVSLLRKAPKTGPS